MNFTSDDHTISFNVDELELMDEVTPYPDKPEWLYDPQTIFETLKIWSADVCSNHIDCPDQTVMTTYAYGGGGPVLIHTLTIDEVPLPQTFGPFDITVSCTIGGTPGMIIGTVKYIYVP